MELLVFSTFRFRQLRYSKLWIFGNFSIRCPWYSKLSTKKPRRLFRPRGMHPGNSRPRKRPSHRYQTSLDHRRWIIFVIFFVAIIIPPARRPPIDGLAYVSNQKLRHVTSTFCNFLTVRLNAFRVARWLVFSTDFRPVNIFIPICLRAGYGKYVLGACAFSIMKRVYRKW